VYQGSSSNVWVPSCFNFPPRYSIFHYFVIYYFKVSQFMHSPQEHHWRAIKWILRYLIGTKHHGLQICPSTQLNWYAFCDVDWEVDLDDRKSISGYYVYYGSSVIAWSSCKQKVVSRNSTKVEYRSLAAILSELLWICSLLSKLHVSFTVTQIILVQSCFPWIPCKQKVVSRNSTKVEYRSLATILYELLWICSLLSKLHVSFTVTQIILVQSCFPRILFFIPKLSTLSLISILYVIIFANVILSSLTYHPNSK